MKTPEPEAVSLFTKTPPPVTKTPMPLSIKTPTPIPAPLLADASFAASFDASAIDPAAAVKTPPPVAERDPSSALPSIPPAKKEPSGAFPLPGMAPEAAKSSDEDATLIARLSLLDEVGDESTKVEPIETALRAAASKEEPIALIDQALAERGKALGVSPEDRIAAAAFEVPENDDEPTVSATPGIISISDDDDEDETTASQRPQGARKTPTPTTVGPHLQTPQPLLGGGQRIPTPVRTSHLPAPGSDFAPVPTPLVSPPSVSHRSLTPALPISAPQGFPTSVGAARSAIFNKVQLPLGGLVAFFVAMFGLGLLFGAWLWRGQGPITAEAPAPTPTSPSAVAMPPRAAVPPPAVAAEPTPAAAAPAEPKPPEPSPAPAPEKAATVEPVHAMPAPVVEAHPARRVAIARPKLAIRKPATGTTTPTAGTAVVAPKPPAKPAAAAAVNPPAKPLTASASKP
ncbi:MAG TPA: hypothetical protein VMT47_03415, partial [Polyangia bacterium]|nr:hypothetical protein [Polyangia bacterium]